MNKNWVFIITINNSIIQLTFLTPDVIYTIQFVKTWDFQLLWETDTVQLLLFSHGEMLSKMIN
jgi:hypothetical protein